MENALSKQIRAKGHREAIVPVKQSPVLFLSFAPVDSPKPASWAVWMGQGESHSSVCRLHDRLHEKLVYRKSVCLHHCPEDL